MAVDANTKLLIHFEEATGNLVDEVGARTFTPASALSINTTDTGMFGRALAVTDVNFYAVGSSPVVLTNEFTIEFFLRRNGATPEAFGVVFGQTSDPVNWSDGVVIGQDSDTMIDCYIANDVFLMDILAGATHCHYAIVLKSDGTLIGYRDGVQQFSTTVAFTPANAYMPYVGGLPDGSGTYSLTGFDLDELRVSDVARYTADFAPPTAEFGGATTPTGGTHGTLFSYPFDLGDTEPIANQGTDTTHTLSSTGGVTSGVMAAPGGGTALRLDAAQYDATWKSASGTFSSSGVIDDFTLKAWVYMGYAQLGSTDIFGLGGVTLGVRANDGELYAYGDNGIGTNTGTASLSSTVRVPENTWTHIALVRVSGVITGYLNGQALENTVPYAPTLEKGYTFAPYSGPVIGGGGVFSNFSIDGWIDDFVADNTAHYTANFTPTTRTGGAPVTPVTPTADVTLSGDATLGDMVGAGSFYCGIPIELSGSTALDDVTQVGVMSILGDAQFSGAATLGPVVGAGAMGANEPQALRGAFTAPMPILTMRASPSVVYGVVAVAPRPSLVARGGHQAVLQGPMPTLTATATTMQMARAILTSPMPYLQATGRVSGQSAVQATAPRPTLVARGGHQATGTLPTATLTMSATAGGVARATMTAPRATLDARITNDNTAKIVATAPMLRAIPSGRVQATAPMGTLMASASGVQAVAYESYVLNMNQPLDDNPRNNFEAKVEQATRYTNWPFTQVVRMANAYYGVAADGLYELGGTTDNGAEIQWRIETCKTDFGEPHRKTVASAYVAGQTGALIDYTLRSGDDPDTVYAYTTTKTVEKRNHRQKFGLGRRNRYYSFGLAGTGKAAIDSIELELLSTTRRI